MRADPDQIKNWFELIHPVEEDGCTNGLIHINSQTPTDRNWTGRTFSEHDNSVKYAVSLDSDLGIYMRTTSLASVPREGKRGGDIDSKMLPGYAADIDLPSDARKHTKAMPLVPDVDSAFMLVEQTGLPRPTLWVHSGWGLYPWWIFNTPLDLTDPDNMAQAKVISDKFQATLGRWADHFGWDYGTGVKDMARVLRIPGTVNRKVASEHRMCHIMADVSHYEHYDFDEFAAAVLTAYDNAPVPVSYRPPRQEPKPREEGSPLKPGEDFNERGSWYDILPQHGWVLSKPPAGRTLYWRRPGKEYGTSATTGYDASADRLFIFSTSTEFESWTPINKHHALAVLEFGGDHSAATRYLRSQGYGSELPKIDHSFDPTGLIRPASQVAVAEQAVDEKQPLQATLVVQADETLPVLGHGDLPPLGVPIELDLRGEQDAVVSIMHSINVGHIPDLYVRDGQLVHVQRKSSITENQVVVAEVCADRLNLLMSCHVRTFRTVNDKNGNPVRKAYSPSISTLRAVVKSNYWPGVPALAGVIGTPTLRPDGSLIQEPGYDKATGLYLQPTIQVPNVPESISDEQVRASREFMFKKVFGEFCWVSPGDFANYMALLASPMLRPYVKSTTPFGMFTATTPGSGKTNLTDAIGLVYGQSSQVLPNRTEELQKKITSILIGNSSPVVVFDNLREGTSISSEILATLVTKDTWDDRMLGASRNIEANNDRLWLASGNGLTVGGDMASRTVMVRLDPRMEKPELRNFEMGQFSDWIREEDNRRELLYHLLVLVQAWRQAGATKDTTHTMRGFTRWAQVMGGFLNFHGLPGFLGNAGELAERDTDAEDWGTFLKKWSEIFGPTAKTSKELHASAQVDYVMGTMVDKWSRCFITDDEGMTPNPRRLGMMLAGQEGRIRNGYVLRKRMSHEKSQLWWVEKVEE